VRAIADGVTALAQEQFLGGRTVVLDHGGGVFSLYMHLQSYRVEEGRRVSRGETIGAVGSTGRSTGPHLHFGVRVTGGRVDPSLLLALP
jgi:murein DD-endopeptidase MepM/ murein hydrolase activator NlpD